MTGTLAYYEKGRNEVPDRAYGHTRQPTGFRESDQSPTSATLGDGGVYSCLEDLAKWDEALRTNACPGRIWRRRSRRCPWPTGSEPLWPKEESGGDNLFPGRPVAYGFGWFLDPWQGHSAPRTTARRWASGRSSSASRRTA